MCTVYVGSQNAVYKYRTALYRIAGNIGEARNKFW